MSRCLNQEDGYRSGCGKGVSSRKRWHDQGQGRALVGSACKPGTYVDCKKKKAHDLKVENDVLFGGFTEDVSWVQPLRSL